MMHWTTHRRCLAITAAAGLWLIATLPVGMAYAQPAPAAVTVTPKADDDSNKPVNIEADRGSYDDLKQVAVFIGNVVLTRGSLVIRADRIEVRQSPEGFQFGTAFGNGDKLATFRRKRPGITDEYVEGQAERIEYDGQTDVVTLMQRAQMRRLQGATVFDEISGHTITYNNRTDVYNVAGGTSAKDAGNPQGRVRATIAPRVTTNDNGAKGAARPARTPLQPAGSLGAIPAER